MKRFHIRYLRWRMSQLLVGLFPALGRALNFHNRTLCLRDLGKVRSKRIVEQPVTTTAQHQRFMAMINGQASSVIRSAFALVELEDVELLGNRGAILSPQHAARVHPTLADPPPPHYNDLRARPLRCVAKPDGLCFSMICTRKGHRNLFHFFHDRVNRLYDMLEGFGMADQPLTLAVQPDIPGYQRDFYAFFCRQYPNVRLEMLGPKQKWRIARLLVHDIDRHGADGHVDPDCAAWIRHLFAHGYALHDQPGTSGRLFVSRRDARTRHIANEDELRPLLERLGFDYICAAQLDYREQVRLFHHARVVVAIHGAGLTNMIHCRPGTHIVEIHPGNRIRDCYFHMARALGHDYHWLLGEAGNRRERFHLDPATLEQTLHRLCD